MMQMMTRDQFEANEQVPTDFLSLDQRTHLAGLDTNRFVGDNKLHVRFYTMPIQDALQTELQNRPVYKDTECIEIWIPGDKTNINNRPVQLDDKMRFKAQYDAWKRGIVLQTGTPLKLAPFVTASQAAELEFFRITTVEQLAGVADNLMGTMAGLTLLKQQAQAYLDKAGGTEAVREQFDAMKAEMEALRAQIAAMGAVPATVTVAVPDKPKKAVPKAVPKPETQDNSAGVLG
jgi:hypothetical protein